MPPLHNWSSARNSASNLSTKKSRPQGHVLARSPHGSSLTHTSTELLAAGNNTNAYIVSSEVEPNCQGLAPADPPPARSPHDSSLTHTSTESLAAGNNTNAYIVLSEVEPNCQGLVPADPPPPSKTIQEFSEHQPRPH